MNRKQYVKEQSNIWYHGFEYKSKRTRVVKTVGVCVCDAENMDTSESRDYPTRICNLIRAHWRRLQIQIHTHLSADSTPRGGGRWPEIRGPHPMPGWRHPPSPAPLGFAA